MCVLCEADYSNSKRADGHRLINDVHLHLCYKSSTILNLSDRLRRSTFVLCAQSTGVVYPRWVLLNYTGFWCSTNAFISLLASEIRARVPLKMFLVLPHSISTFLFPVSCFLSVEGSETAWLSWPVSCEGSTGRCPPPKKLGADFTDPLQGVTKSCVISDTFLYNDLTWPKMTQGCQGSYWAERGNVEEECLRGRCR